MSGFNSITDIESTDYKGYYIGTVVANDDPLKQQRIKVQIPDLIEGAAALLPWVAPMHRSPFGYTATAGVVEVPVIGARVVVEFQEGDLSYGLVRGSIPTKAFTIPAELAVNYPARYGWKDPAGNVWFIDTTAGQVVVQFKHVSGTTLEINNAGKVTATSMDEVEITAASKVTINAPTQMDINSPIVNVSGDMNVTGTVTAEDLAAGIIPSYLHHVHNYENETKFTSLPVA